MNLLDLIVKWHGQKRGAISAFARAAGVNQSVVTQWVRGVGPMEARWPRLAQILEIETEKLAASVAVTKKDVYYPLQGQASGLLLKAVRRIEFLEARMDDLEKAFFMPAEKEKIAKRRYPTKNRE